VGTTLGWAQRAPTREYGDQERGGTRGDRGPTSIGTWTEVLGGGTPTTSYAGKQWAGGPADAGFVGF